jgi:DnaJ-class molecular chaperone
MIFHPDKHIQPEQKEMAERKITRINEAYEGPSAMVDFRFHAFF